MLITTILKALQYIFCIFYSVKFQINKLKKIETLIDSNNKINAKTFIFINKISLIYN